jgi:hypothetical protein
MFTQEEDPLWFAGLDWAGEPHTRGSATLLSQAPKYDRPQLAAQHGDDTIGQS